MPKNEITQPSAAEMASIEAEFADIIEPIKAAKPKKTAKSKKTAKKKTVSKKATATVVDENTGEILAEPGEMVAAPTGVPQPKTIWNSGIERKTKAWNCNKNRTKSFLGLVVKRETQSGYSKHVYFVDLGDEIIRVQSSKDVGSEGDRIEFTAEPYERQEHPTFSKPLMLGRSLRGIRLIA